VADWLSDYLDYTAHQESPTTYHRWCGITTLAATLGRNVWTDRRAVGVSWYQVYPGQMMMILVGPPAKGHKSTALRLGKRLLDKIGVKVIKGKGSTEKIINEIAIPPPGAILQQTPHAVATLYAPELSVMLSKATYAETMIDFLTDIFDAEDPFSYMTQGRGIVTLRFPCVTLYAAATPASVARSIPITAVETGFASRVLWVWHNGTERAANALTDLDDEDTPQDVINAILATEQRLIDRLRVIKTLRGPFKYDSDARRWMNDWYNKYKQDPSAQGEGWPGRRPDYLLRLSMIFCVAKQDDLVHTKKHLVQANDELYELETKFHYAFAEVGTQQNIVKQRDRVLTIVRAANGRISAMDLHRSAHGYFVSLDDLKNCIRDLMETGYIKSDGIINGVQYFSLVT
jgi:hypothetical protein